MKMAAGIPNMNSFLLTITILLISFSVETDGQTSQEKKAEIFTNVLTFTATQLSPECAKRVLECTEKYNASHDLFVQQEACQLVSFSNKFGTTRDCLVNLGPCSQEEYHQLVQVSCPEGRNSAQTVRVAAETVVCLSVCWLVLMVCGRYT